MSDDQKRRYFMRELLFERYGHTTVTKEMYEKVVSDNIVLLRAFSIELKRMKGGE